MKSKSKVVQILEISLGILTFLIITWASVASWVGPKHIPTGLMIGLGIIPGLYYLLVLKPTKSKQS